MLTEGKKYTILFVQWNQYYNVTYLLDQSICIFVMSRGNIDYFRIFMDEHPAEYIKKRDCPTPYNIYHPVRRWWTSHQIFIVWTNCDNLQILSMVQKFNTRGPSTLLQIIHLGVIITTRIFIENSPNYSLKNHRVCKKVNQYCVFFLSFCLTFFYCSSSVFFYIIYENTGQTGEVFYHYYYYYSTREVD